MYASYNNLWKTLINKGIKKEKHCQKTGISNTLSKINRNEPASLSIILKICELLDYAIKDVVSINKKSE